ncbi:MAG: family 43 glycosylhydrolase [Pyrinomonadaceae bacterium]|nr:family 43 glycosylhydrolase [Pyrinomonadaceae bacterium]
MMRARFLFVFMLLWLCSVAGTLAQPPATFSNPVIAGDFPDPSVIRAGEDYYAATTSGTWAPHFPILHSRDLVNWKVVGHVFQQPPAWTLRDFWAPELITDRGRFFAYYTARRNDGKGKKGTLCIAVATAARPEGPYTDHGPLVCQEAGSIDPFVTRDENNRLYLIWKEDGNDRNQPTPIWAQPLSDDGIKLAGKRVEILRNDKPWERHVIEGSYILRRGGWFYHFYSGNACCGRGCDYALGVARSRKLLGPWEKHPANPILPANDAWQCPGHGSIVSTPDGRDFLLYHAYRRRPDAFNIGREALLDEIKWDGTGNWPSINSGQGPSTAPASIERATKEPEKEFFDGFNVAQLDPAWAWPMYNKQSAMVETGPGGYLVLSARGTKPAPGAQLLMTGAVLGWRTTAGDYVATALLNTQGLQTGACGGLAAYSHRNGAIGVAICGGNKVLVWRREEQEQRTLATAEAPPGTSTIYLRLTATGGELYRFAVSTNGRDWKELGEPVAGSFVEGARVALTAGGKPGASARFDWVRVTPSVAKK